MPHGAPDWYKYRRDSATFPIDDLAEHAVRLGSIDTFDRRGDVLEMDDFEQGTLKWRFSLYGAGARGAISPTHARSKGYSMELITGSDGGQEILAQWRLPYPKLSKTGLELSFAMGTDLFRIPWALHRHDGTLGYTFELHYNNNTFELSYLNPLGLRTVFATGVRLYNAPHLFNYLKLVADLSNNTYVRAIVNEVQYDLSGCPCYITASALIPHLEISMRCAGNLGTNISSYVDDVIVTRDEP